MSWDGMGWDGSDGMARMGWDERDEMSLLLA